MNKKLYIYFSSRDKPTWDDKTNTFHFTVSKILPHKWNLFNFICASVLSTINWDWPTWSVRNRPYDWTIDS